MKYSLSEMIAAGDDMLKKGWKSELIPERADYVYKWTSPDGKEFEGNPNMGHNVAPEAAINHFYGVCKGE